ncbi:MAG: thiol:disulfide interchange protein [Moraxellaceae bacterium]|nr:MAG: thiol:disulfide interchange protein [Moraxellaceae bacterium]
MPVESPLPITTAINKDHLTIIINGLGVQSNQIKSIWFYPEEWGWIKQSSEQPWKIAGDNVELTLQLGEAPLKTGDVLKGVLVVTEQGTENTPARGFIVSEALAANSNSAQEPGISETGKQELGLFTALILALLGGIILNLMPCVFPVLSIKVLSLVAHSNQSAKQIRAHGYIYALGVLTSFLALGIILILFKAAGAQIGWGFQFQSPLFVLLVAYLLFAVGLSLSGVFFIGGSVSNVGASLTERNGYTGSFFTGVLATVVATPCTAPFMAAALGYALAQPPLILIAIFLALGLGLALPYVLLTHWPALQRWLPRPGLWMERVKQALAFPMYAAAVWLVWVLAQQSGANAVAAALVGMILIAIAAWLYDSTRRGSTSARHIGNVFALLVLIASFIVGYFGLQLESTNSDRVSTIGEKNWEVYSEERLNDLLAEGKPVFLNFTAAWCISCLANERVALSNQRVIDAFKSTGITYLKGDWTKRDSEITKVLKKFDRSGVPLYVFYPAGGKNNSVSPVELPQILTPDIVLNTVQQLPPSSVQPLVLNP